MVGTADAVGAATKLGTGEHIANGTADPDFDGTLREAVTVYLASRRIWTWSPTSACAARCS